MNQILLTRSALQHAYRNNPVESLCLSMFIIDEREYQQAELVLFVNEGPGAIRLCKILKDRSASL